jgi:hypothetical protein
MGRSKPTETMDAVAGVQRSVTECRQSVLTALMAEHHTTALLLTHFHSSTEN